MRYHVTFALHPFSLMLDLVIPAVPAAGIYGHLDRATGSIMMPDLAALHVAVPRAYKRSLERKTMGNAIWFNKWYPDAPAWLTFRDRDGLTMNAAYFTPIYAASNAMN